MSNSKICDVDTPDPWMVTANNRFYLTFTLGDRIEVWSSENMEDFRQCQKSLVWQPQPGSQWSTDVWAPELHQIQDQWYIYFCAAHPQHGNKSHRTLVLRSWHPDPMNAAGWSMIGPLKGLPDHWNIDATVFSPRHDELYCCYSGWPLGDHSDTQQDLFLVKLASPAVAMPDTLTCISKATLGWERPESGRRGVNEGPTWVDMPGFRGIVYSANGSWTCDYQLGILRLIGEDLLKESSWQKRPIPLLLSDSSKGSPYGPGHASFINSPYNDGLVYCIYHGTEKPDEGWRNRKARVICLGPESFRDDAESLCCGAIYTRHNHGARNSLPPSQSIPPALQSQQSLRSIFDDIGSKARNLWKGIVS